MTKIGSGIFFLCMNGSVETLLSQRGTLFLEREEPPAWVGLGRVHCRERKALSGCQLWGLAYGPQLCRAQDTLWPSQPQC